MAEPIVKLRRRSHNALLARRLLRLVLGVGNDTSNPRILSELNLAQRLTLRAFLRPFADALDGDPQKTSCEESVVRLLSFTMGSAIESLHYQSHQWHGCDMYQPRFDT